MRSSLPLNVKISLQLAGTSSTVTVEAAGDLLETIRPRTPMWTASCSEASAGERVILGQFAGDARVTWSRRGFERAIPRSRRSCGKFFLG